MQLEIKEMKRKKPTTERQPRSKQDRQEETQQTGVRQFSLDTVFLLDEVISRTRSAER